MIKRGVWKIPPPVGEQLWLMAFWPRYGEKVLAKTKDIELRRCAAGRGLGIAAGVRILIYETAPVSAVVGDCVVLMEWAGVPRETIIGFLGTSLEALGMADAKEFDEFFGKHTHAHVIALTNPRRYRQPIRVTREITPRSYRRISEDVAEDFWRRGESPGAAPALNRGIEQ